MGSFTGNNQNSSVVRVGPYDTVQWTLSVAGGDSMTATVAFQKSPTGAGGWETLNSETVVGSGTYSNDRDEELFVRLRTTAHSGDDVVWALVLSDDKYDSLTFRDSEIRDTDGVSAMSIRKGAVTIPQDVVVGGSMTISGLNISEASEVSESIAGAGTFTPTFTTPTHYKITLTGTTATFADPTSTPTGTFPIWLTIINSSGGVRDISADVTFGSAWNNTSTAFTIADSAQVTLSYIWDNGASELSQTAAPTTAVDPFSIAGDITTSGGDIDATAGSLNAGTTVTAGTGITATTGNVAASGGNVTASGLMSAGTTVTGGTGITATTGNIAASSGNVTASGLMSAGTTVTAGTGITATTGNIAASSGNVTASGLVSAGTTVTAGTGMTVTTGNLLVSTGNITATSGDVVVSSGNVTITTGSVTVGTALTGPNGNAYTWVDRGDPSAWDYVITTDLTADSTFNLKNLSSITGTGRRLVLFRAQHRSNTVGHILQLKEDGNSNAFNSGSLATMVSGVTVQGDLWCWTDANADIRYLVTTGSLTANLCIRGWFEQA